MNIFFLKTIIKISVKHVILNKTRSLLTVLGIIFGTASVIAMLSIGEGARREALEQIRKLGSQNVIVNSKKPPEETNVSSKEQNQVIQYGLTDKDMEIIKNSIPDVKNIVPTRNIELNIKYESRQFQGNILSIFPKYFEVSNTKINEGRLLNALDIKTFLKVCVIGQTIKKKLFDFNQCLGKEIKIGSKFFTIIGTIENISHKTTGSSIKSRDVNKDVYIPYTTAEKVFGATIFKQKTGSFEAEKVKYHDFYIHFNGIESVLTSSVIIKNILKNNHKKDDYEVIVPLSLLYQQKKTQQTFNIVMLSIAGISLLVGGIGIMNIMLATVTERTKEIGIRRALGATKNDITIQFLLESTVLSGIGGLIGIIAGISGAFTVTKYAGWLTVLTPYSIIICFIISVSIGIIFGLYPASKAANMDPIEALRYE